MPQGLPFRRGNGFPMPMPGGSGGSGGDGMDYINRDGANSCSGDGDGGGGGLCSGGTWVMAATHVGSGQIAYIPLCVKDVIEPEV